MAERDPIIDPIPGDVLRKGFTGYEREVDECEDGWVTYVGENVCSPMIQIKSWRKWAANATVVRQAQEESTK